MIEPGLYVGSVMHRRSRPMQRRFEYRVFWLILDLDRLPETMSALNLLSVERFSKVMHIVSTVEGELAEGAHPLDALAVTFPAGTVTGAPKLAALAQIAALEPVGRGPSMGALGWLDHRQLDLGLTIRTVAVDADRVHLWAGGGITWDSDPAAEVAEAAAKAAPLRAALAHPR